MAVFVKDLTKISALDSHRILVITSNQLLTTNFFKNMEVRINGPKWATRAAAASGDYASGAASPRRSWSQAASAAEENYKAGIAEASARGAYGKGISAAGDAKWQRGIAEKGRTRYQQGVAVSQDNYVRGFQPYADTLRSITLTPRGPKGTNYGRTQQVGDAMRARKMQG